MNVMLKTPGGGPAIVIVRVLPEPETRPGIAVTTPGSLSNLTVIVPFAGRSPLGGIALTKAASPYQRSSLSSPSFVQLLLRHYTIIK